MLKHLAEHDDLNEQIGEHGMHLFLQLLGTALGDRRLSLLYLELVSTHSTLALALAQFPLPQNSLSLHRQ